MESDMVLGAWAMLGEIRRGGILTVADGDYKSGQAFLG
jgi:hypothetical protein